MARTVAELTEAFQACNVLVGDPRRPYNAMQPMIRRDGRFYDPEGRLLALTSADLIEGHIREATPQECAEYKHAAGWVYYGAGGLKGYPQASEDHGDPS